MVGGLAACFEEGAINAEVVHVSEKTFDSSCVKRMWDTLSCAFRSSATFQCGVPCTPACAICHVPSRSLAELLRTSPAAVTQVIGPFWYRLGDLRRMAPWWMKYSEDVRMDPEVRHLAGL